MTCCWLDITGVRPGSDAAYMALALGDALQGHTAVRVCQRIPGLRKEPWTALEALAASPPPPDLHVPPVGRLGLAQRLPAPTRAAIRRFVATQRAALKAWASMIHPANPTLPPGESEDTAAPASGDLLLMLMPSGDAGRFAAAGVRLVLLSADPTALIRPDWAEPAAAEAAAIWLSKTAPHISTVIAWSAEAADALRAYGLPAPIVLAAAASIAHDACDEDYVIAAGEISEAGHTRHLLLAWRKLLDEMPPDTVPPLVLAGPIGPLSDDVIAQLRNSRQFDGAMRVAANPTAAEFSRLLAASRFVIAAEAGGWGRATWDGLAAGRACLSSFAAPGATAITPSKISALADGIRRWIETPPSPSEPMAPRGWSDVAADLLKVLAP
jgi:hypothetical protein